MRCAERPCTETASGARVDVHTCKCMRAQTKACLREFVQPNKATPIKLCCGALQRRRRNESKSPFQSHAANPNPGRDQAALDTATIAPDAGDGLKRNTLLISPAVLMEAGSGTEVDGNSASIRLCSLRNRCADSNGNMSSPARSPPPALSQHRKHHRPSPERLSSIKFHSQANS